MIFREATLEDGLAVLADLREAQCLTLNKLKLDPEALLRRAMNGSRAMAVIIDGKPAAVFGVVSSSLIGLAKIWLITTPAVEREPVAFLRNSKAFTRALFEEHGMLIGTVDKDFPKSRRWLEWLGFVPFREGDITIMRYSGGH